MDLPEYCRSAVVTLDSAAKDNYKKVYTFDFDLHHILQQADKVSNYPLTVSIFSIMQLWVVSSIVKMIQGIQSEWWEMMTIGISGLYQLRDCSPDPEEHPLCVSFYDNIICILSLLKLDYIRPECKLELIRYACKDVISFFKLMEYWPDMYNVSKEAALLIYRGAIRLNVYSLFVRQTVMSKVPKKIISLLPIPMCVKSKYTSSIIKALDELEKSKFKPERKEFIKQWAMENIHALHGENSGHGNSTTQ
jgi:hypothetical protein